MYGMLKTTIYLPEEMKLELQKIAASRGISEAELIREALKGIIESSAPPKPKLPLFKSANPNLAENVDKYLQGFGEF
jgi:hypothetical protein